MKILASDYDGTLRRGGIIEKYDIDAISVFRKAGNKFGIVTGRSLNRLKTDFDEYNVEIDFIVGTNGGIIADADYNKIKSFDIDFNRALDFIEKYRDRTDFSIAVGDGYKTARISRPFDTHFNKYESSSTVEDILENKIINIFVIGLKNPELRSRLIDEFTQEFSDCLNFHKNMTIIDISAGGIYKSTGLEYVKNMYKAEELYVIGDELNDIEMIRKFNGFCVTNARDEVKEYATEMFDSVAACIEHIMRR